MEHRDEVILRKVLSEIDIAENMMGDHSLAEFSDNEMLKRAVCMTVINIGELVKNLSESPRYSLESDRRFSRYRRSQIPNAENGRCL